MKSRTTEDPFSKDKIAKLQQNKEMSTTKRNKVLVTTLCRWYSMKKVQVELQLYKEKDFKHAKKEPAV